MKVTFNSANGLRLQPKEVIDEIISFMKAGPHYKYKIVIGTDSEEMTDNCADCVTAIVVCRIGNGGRYFWRRTKIDKLYTLRDRIWKEVTTSLDIAKDFLNLIKDFDVPHFDFEIHVDVGESGKTKAMIQELVGVIRANNFEAKTKPYSYAASSVADRHNHPYER